MAEKTITPKPDPKKTFQSIKDELKNVTWPTRKKTTQLTLTVFVICLIVGAYVGIIDIVLTKVLEVLTKI